MTAFWWRRKPLHAVIADELYESRRDLLAAERHCDYWLAVRNSLKARVIRLEAAIPTLTEEVQDGKKP